MNRRYSPVAGSIWRPTKCLTVLVVEDLEDKHRKDLRRELNKLDA